MKWIVLQDEFLHFLMSSSLICGDDFLCYYSSIETNYPKHKEELRMKDVLIFDTNDSNNEQNHWTYPHNAGLGYGISYPPPGGQYVFHPYDIVNQQIEKMEYQAHIEMQKIQEIENIKMQAICKRKAMSLDLQEMHEHRRTEVVMTCDNIPLLRKEMLSTTDKDRKIAAISHCTSTIYETERYTEKDQIHRIIEINFVNEMTKDACNFLFDITLPDERKFRKILQSRGVKFLCGRRRFDEYSGKLLEGFITVARVVQLPSRCGFYLKKLNNQLQVFYVPEDQLTWQEVVRNCL